MCRCWKENPNDRPSLAEVASSLATLRASLAAQNAQEDEAEQAAKVLKGAAGVEAPTKNTSLDEGLDDLDGDLEIDDDADDSWLGSGDNVYAGAEALLVEKPAAVTGETAAAAKAAEAAAGIVNDPLGTPWVPPPPRGKGPPPPDPAAPLGFFGEPTAGAAFSSILSSPSSKVPTGALPEPLD